MNILLAGGAGYIGSHTASHDNKRHEKRQCNNMLSTKSLANMPYLFPFFFYIHMLLSHPPFFRFPECV